MGLSAGRSGGGDVGDGGVLGRYSLGSRVAGCHVAVVADDLCLLGGVPAGDRGGLGMGPGETLPVPPSTGVI